jgi:hypothetical protein
MRKRSEVSSQKTEERKKVKKLKGLISLLVVLLAVAPLFAQKVNQAKLKINGIVGLDSTYAQVVKTFGKPAKETKPQKEECTGGREKTVDYAGLTFYFMSGPSRDHKTFLVMSFDVTSTKYAVSGIKLGDSEAVVRQRLGTRFTSDKDDATGKTAWIYEISERNGGPGQTTVTFKNGKVVGISSAYAVC